MFSKHSTVLLTNWQTWIFHIKSSIPELFTKLKDGPMYRHVILRRVHLSIFNKSHRCTDVRSKLNNGQRRHARARFQLCWRCKRHLPWSHSPGRTSSSLTRPGGWYSCMGEHALAKSWCCLVRSWMWSWKLPGDQSHRRTPLENSARIPATLFRSVLL